MIRTKNIPIWLVLAVQIQLDKHYMLLDDTNRAHQELADSCEEITGTLQQYQDFSENMSISTWGEFNDNALQGLIHEWEWWLVQTWFHRAFQDMKIPVQENDRYFVLLERHPVLCGMLLFRLKMVMQSLGVILVNAWGSLPTVLHLYNAARVEGALVKPWMDLEPVVSEYHTFIVIDAWDNYFESINGLMGIQANRCLCTDPTQHSWACICRKAAQQSERLLEAVRTRHGDICFNVRA